MFCEGAGVQAAQVQVVKMDFLPFRELVRGQLQFVNAQFRGVENQSRTMVVGKVSISVFKVEAANKILCML